MNLVAQEFSDLAPPYVFTCALLVNINLLMETITDGVQWAIWFHDTNGAVWKEGKMYFSVVSLFLYTTIFALLYDLCSSLHNPFGPRDFLDLPHHSMGAQVRRLAKTLAAADHPSTMVEKQVGPLQNVEIGISNSSLRKIDAKMARMSMKMNNNLMRPRGVTRYHRNLQQKSSRNLLS